MADRSLDTTRKRIELHKVFDETWRTPLQRSNRYRKLARLLKIPEKRAHFRMFKDDDMPKVEWAVRKIHQSFIDSQQPHYPQHKKVERKTQLEDAEMRDAIRQMVYERDHPIRSKLSKLFSHYKAL